MISNMFSLPFKPPATAQKAKSLAGAAVQCLLQWGKPFNIIKVPNFLGMIPLSDDSRFLCSYVHPCGPASLLVCYHLFHICCGVGVAAKTIQVLEIISSFRGCVPGTGQQAWRQLLAVRIGCCAGGCSKGVQVMGME